MNGTDSVSPFSQSWATKKRGRDLDDEYGTSGFSEHRQKRRIASLPHRTSPNAQRQISNPFAASSFVYTTAQAPAPPTITPADSDNEDAASGPAEVQDRSFFSPWSSSPTYKMDASSEPTPMDHAPIYSDDMEMVDSDAGVHLSPGPFTNDPSPSISGRIPTPIQSSFAPYVRSPQPPRIHNANPCLPSTISSSPLNSIEQIRRGRRLPSPISEGETSPSVIVDGLDSMQMEVDHSQQSPSQFSQSSQVDGTPTKKGHTRSKHSLRSWTALGFGGEGSGNGVKRSFSMGYRSDCEKCRMKVPGHFSHIITYD